MMFLVRSGPDAWRERLVRAPKCLKCGGEHWSREPCAKAASDVEARKAIGKEILKHTQVTAPGLVVSPATEAAIEKNLKADAPHRGKPAVVLAPEVERLRLELERVSGMKVRLSDPAKTRAYNRVYMAERRAAELAGKSKKKGGAK